MVQTGHEVQAAEHSTSKITPYQYWAQVERVVDGDTLDLRVAVGFDTEIRGRFRLLGIDTPEMFGVTHDSPQYRAGLAARLRVKELIPDDRWVEVKTYKAASREKYGRYLCEVFINGRSLNQQLLDEGHARPLGS